jgi:transcriptional regulator NrdR family protein
MTCPKCGGEVNVMDSRPGPANTIRRRRLCEAPGCRHRFTTYEVHLEAAPLTPAATAFLIDQLTKAHEETGRRLALLSEAVQAAALITQLDSP